MRTGLQINAVGLVSIAQRQGFPFIGVVELNAAQLLKGHFAINVDGP